MKYVVQLLLAILMMNAVTTAKTITLQQGIEGYYGCQDAYIESKDADGYNGSYENHGEEEIFAAANTRYVWY